MTQVTPGVEMPYFNIADPEFAMQSEEVRRARDESWIAKTNYGYAVLRHAEVGALLRSKSLSQGSAQWPEHHGVHSGSFYEWWSKNLLVLEGTEHTRIRRLLNPAFSPARARKLKDSFQVLADDLVGQLTQRDSAEFVNDFAAPFATRALCIMLGLPEEHWEFIADRADTIGLALSVNIEEEIDSIDKAVEELYEFVEGLIQERRDNPTDDVISKLVTQSSDKDSLSPEELRNAIVLMLFGGMDTTRNQLGLAIQTFMHNPQEWEKLAADPSLVDRALEEVLRVNPTTRWVTREAIEDFEYQGVEFTAGTTVHLFTASSGTDVEAFPNPEINIGETDRKAHFTFGGGKHQCIGQHIAKADMSVALATLAAAITDIQLDGADEWLPDSGNTGPIRLPIRFSKRS